MEHGTGGAGAGVLTSTDGTLRNYNCLPAILFICFDSALFCLVATLRIFVIGELEMTFLFIL